MSFLGYEEFLNAMSSVAKEFYRILKEDSICAFMIGDIRKNGKIMPLGMDSLNIFRENGFNIKEIIIKRQYNCLSTEYWKNKKRDFLMIVHEYIFVLHKHRISSIKN